MDQRCAATLSEACSALKGHVDIAFLMCIAMLEQVQRRAELQVQLLRPATTPLFEACSRAAALVLHLLQAGIRALFRSHPRTIVRAQHTDLQGPLHTQPGPRTALRSFPGKGALCRI